MADDKDQTARDATADTPAKESTRPASVTTAPPETPAAASAVLATDDAVDELPEGAVLAAPAGLEPTSASGNSRPNIIAPFADEHVGKGGTYIIGDDGVRRPVYERFSTPDPDHTGGGDAPMVDRYRRVM